MRSDIIQACCRLMASDIDIGSLAALLADRRIDTQLADLLEHRIDTLMHDDPIDHGIVDLQFTAIMPMHARSKTAARINLLTSEQMALVVDMLECNEGWYNSGDLSVMQPYGNKYRGILWISGLDALDKFKDDRQYARCLGFSSDKDKVLIKKEIWTDILRCSIKRDNGLYIEDFDGNYHCLSDVEPVKDLTKADCRNYFVLDYSMTVRTIAMLNHEKKIVLMPISQELLRLLPVVKNKQKNIMKNRFVHSMFDGPFANLPAPPTEIKQDLKQILENQAHHMILNSKVIDCGDIDSFAFRRNIIYTVSHIGKVQKWLIQRPDLKQPIAGVDLMRTAKLGMPGYTSFNISQGLRLVIVSSHNKSTNTSHFTLLDEDLVPLSEYSLPGSERTVRSCICLVANLHVCLALDSNFDVIVFSLHDATLRMLQCRFVGRSISPMPRHWYEIALPYVHDDCPDTAEFWSNDS